MHLRIIEKVLAHFRHLVEQLVTGTDAHGFDFDSLNNRDRERIGNTRALDLGADDRDFFNLLVLVVFRLLRKNCAGSGRQQHREY